MGADWQYVDIAIPRDIGPADREALADEIIDFIRERTSSGLDKNNREFGGYSEAYIKSANFRIAGKSKSEVNLTLSGDMMGDIDLLSHRKGNLRIGFQRGSESNAKADGNIKGTYGQEKQVGPKRDFLGITKGDLNALVNIFDFQEREISKQAREGSRGDINVETENDETD